MALNYLLAEDSSFEGGTVGSYVSADVTKVVVSNSALFGASDGTKSLLLSIPVGAFATSVYVQMTPSLRIPCSPGQSFAFVGFSKRAFTNAPSPGFALLMNKRFFDGSGTLIVAGQGSIDLTPASSVTFGSNYFNANAPATAATMELYFQFTGQTAPGATQNESIVLDKLGILSPNTSLATDWVLGSGPISSFTDSVGILLG